ncbi:MAG: hypothetical protein QM484_03970 [Woeseiaceae bacterium]
MTQANSIIDFQEHDHFEEHAIDTVHTLLLNDSVMPMTFLCETNDNRQILILYFMTDQSEIDNKINMVRALMLLNNVNRYIFASETLIPSVKGLNPHEDKNARNGLVLLHADHSGLQKATQYFVERNKDGIKLSGEEQSDSLKTNTDLDSLLSGPIVSTEQRKELEDIVSTLPQNYPVKAYEYSAEISTYQPHGYN